ncbi:DUF3558 domain-containing protein [Actinoalloteichus hoggarensis]|uniref:DUF3558 domain-containing protein n=1 Tax=Actinoalloteichus hoggarensis TaxID=1470176 RepID=UPI0035DC8F85
MILAGLPILLTISSCTQEVGGQVSPADRTSITGSDATGDEDYRLAPPVDNPRNIAELGPCELLSPTTAGAAGFLPDGILEEEPDGSQRCAWQPEDHPDGRVALWTDVDRRGLHEMYVLQENYPDFREFEVAGYPAVQASLGGATEMYCYIHVGVAEDQFVTFSSSLGMKQDDDPCAQAVRVAEVAVPAFPAA